MIVGRHLGNIERVRRFPAEFAQGNAVAYMHGTAALQIGQAEVYSSISAVGGAQDGKQCLVLIDGQKLSITKSPTFGGEIPTDDFDFSQKWF